MKKLSPKIRLKRTLKIVDIDNNKLSEGLGRCPKYPQGTRPLTRILGSAQTRPRRKQGKAQLPLSLCRRIIREPYVKGLSRHILAAAPLRYSTVPLTTVPLSAYPAAFCIFFMVCWPRKISSCHFPGMFSPFAMMSLLTSG